ncbi:hypothetical protein [Sulfurimonas sp.]|jgi:hypothetical protein|uniref:hypothetical protein n=1 Tax=Sulfurimonas sp. TaxID=2022749 RepID=UPI002A3591A1|nr:hypothetical protein [Sulfurimonas sp.]MDY0123681.1 hypothetical protein [Sulfurimonas sp.]
MLISKTTAPLLALLLAASAYGVENVKVSGGAKYWYQTTAKQDAARNDMFQQNTSVGVAAVELGVSADLYEGLKGKASVIGLDSLGLEQSFVKDISSAGAGREADKGYYRTQIWISEANLDYKIANTSVIVGRQALNTPLLFTERWNASYNTFDAAVLINSDLPYTTLVAGYVHQHNGGSSAGNATATNFPSTTMHDGSYYGFGSSYDGTKVTDGKRRAYAFGAMIKPPVENLAVNLWYYNINSTFTAYWADAEYKNSGLFFGIQNAGINLAASGIDDAMITAAKVGYSVDKFSADISCSTTATGENGTATIANAATGDKSKVYTQSVFQDGAFVGARDTDAIRAAASYQFDGLKLTASLQNAEQTSKEGMEFDLIASAKLGKYVSLTGIYIHQDVDEKTAADFKNDAIRLIAAVKF